jgi:hypothetical protein
MFNAYAREVRDDLAASEGRICVTEGRTSVGVATSPAALARETRMLARQSDRGRAGITAPVALWAREIDALADDAPSRNSHGRPHVPGLAVAAVYPEMLRHAAGLP